MGTATRKPKSARDVVVTPAIAAIAIEEPALVGQTCLILLEQIVEDTNHRDETEDTQVAELAASMRAGGLQQPVKVCHLPGGGGGKGKVRLVYGHRRVAAARQLGWTKIPALEVPAVLTDDQVKTERTIENIHRRNLNPAEEALAVCQLLDDLHGDVAAAAARLGKSETWVRDRAYLVNLAPKVRAMLASGEILLGQAREIVKLGDHAKQEEVARYNQVHPEDNVRSKIKQTRRSIELHTRSLLGVSWDLSLPVFGKPACIGCSHNTATPAQKALFGQDALEEGGEEGGQAARAAA